MKTTIATTQADVKVNVHAENTHVNGATSEPALIKKEIVNKVTLTGHLGSNPEIIEVTSGMKRAKFRVATNRYFKNKAGEWQSETTWHNVVAWGRLAGIAEQQFKKGTAVSVDGKLNYRMYQDASGVERFYTEVVAYSMVAVPAAKQSEKEGENTDLKLAA